MQKTQLVVYIDIIKIINIILLKNRSKNKTWKIKDFTEKFEKNISYLR